MSDDRRADGDGGGSRPEVPVGALRGINDLAERRTTGEHDLGEILEI